VKVGVMEFGHIRWSSQISQIFVTLFYNSFHSSRFLHSLCLTFRTTWSIYLRYIKHRWKNYFKTCQNGCRFQ